MQRPEWPHFQNLSNCKCGWADFNWKINGNRRTGWKSSVFSLPLMDSLFIVLRYWVPGWHMHRGLRSTRKEPGRLRSMALFSFCFLTPQCSSETFPSIFQRAKRRWFHICVWFFDRLTSENDLEAVSVIIWCYAWWSCWTTHNIDWMRSLDWPHCIQRQI